MLQIRWYNVEREMGVETFIIRYKYWPEHNDAWTFWFVRMHFELGIEATSIMTQAHCH